MNRSELERAILDTQTAISQIKERIDQTSDPNEVRHLRHKLKELQYLQLWQMETLENTFRLDNKSNPNNVPQTIT